MNEVELVGYTADLRFLVLEIDGDSDRRRLRLPVDPDLVATLDEIRSHRADLPGPAPPGVEDDEATTDAPAAPEATTDAPADPQGAPPGTDGETTDTDEPSEDGEARSTAIDEGHDDVASEATGALTPAQIQALLRSGRSVRSVADAAETDVAWVERWLPPILAEREQVIREARALRLERARLGPSRRPLGDAVDTNLAQRGVGPDDVTWTASRRADGRWTVGVRYRHRGRSRSASWTLHREDRTLAAASEFARELGWLRPRAPVKRSARSRTGVTRGAQRKGLETTAEEAATEAGNKAAKKAGKKAATEAGNKAAKKAGKKAAKKARKKAATKDRKQQQEAVRSARQGGGASERR